MSRRKLPSDSNFALPFQRSDVHLENTPNPKECLTRFNHLTSRDILTIEALNVVSIIYGVMFLTYLLKSDNFLHLGKLTSLYIPVAHTILECIKLQILRSRKLRFEIPSYRDLFSAFLMCTALGHCSIVLFGAEVLSNIEETFVLSCTLTALVLVPSYLFYGRDSIYLLTRQKVTYSPLYASLRSVAYGSVIGAWFGAFVIPLDWERSWQKWPIPCMIGSFVGFLLGHAYSIISQI